jgi:sugar phosphate isomerase/epimerase
MKQNPRTKQKLAKRYVEALITRGVEVDPAEEIARLSRPDGDSPAESAGGRPLYAPGPQLVEFGLGLSSAWFALPGGGKASPGEAAGQLIRGLRKARESGCDFVELPVESLVSLPKGDFDEVKRRIREAGLQIPAFDSLIPEDLAVAGPDADLRKLEAYVDLAMKRIHALGGSLIVLGSGKARSVPDGFPAEQAFDQLRQFLRLCESYAAHYRITIALDPLSRDGGGIIRSAGEALALAAELALPHVKVAADFRQMLREKEPCSVLRKAAEMKLLTHVRLPAPDSGYLPAGGTAAFFAELRKAGYGGDITLECRSRRSAESAQLLDHVREAWFDALAGER